MLYTNKRTCQQDVLTTISNFQEKVKGVLTIATARQVRHIISVRAKGPSNHAASPILEGSESEVGGLVPGCEGGEPAFGHVLVDCWVCVVEV